MSTSRLGVPLVLTALLLHLLPSLAEAQRTDSADRARGVLPDVAGTYWEVQDTMLDDIDRIEVIRGPGGTLWGANPVTGIINIITRSAAAMQGTLVSATAGRDMRGPLGVRYGGRAGSNFHYRLYGRLFDYDEANATADAPGGMRKGQGGFRGDWTLSRSRALTVQGDIYRAGLDQRVRLPLYSPPFEQVFTRDAPLSGGNVRVHWASPGAR